VPPGFPLSKLRGLAVGVFAALALAASASAAEAAALTFRIAPEMTRVEFAVSQFGVATQRGRFERARGTIVVDAERGEGSIDFIVDAASVSTGWDLRDAFLRGELMFDAVRFPTLRFRSTHLVHESSRLVAVDGELTLRGVMRPVRFDVSRADCAAQLGAAHAGCVASVSGRISRRDFGMTFAYPLVGDEVVLEFAVTAFRVRDEGETEVP
jgi:polyisoprenoid-binding protein YceI